MRAIVLVGGQGTRLQPLTLRTLKQLVPVLNRPLLEHLLVHLRDHGVARVTLAMTRHSEAVEQVFGDGRALGMTLDYVYEETPLGSGGAIASVAADWDEPFLVCNGDVLTDLDITAFIATHQRRGALLSIALHEVEDPSPFGVVVLDGDERITRFVEKPPRAEAPSRLINAGTWLFEPAVVREMDGVTMNRPPGEGTPRVEYGLFPALAAAGRGIFGYQGVGGYWLDVGTPETYRQANLELLQGALPRCLPEGWPADGIAIAGARVADEATVAGPVLLGPGTTVGARAELVGPVVAGSRCAVYASARVTRSILWDDVTVQEGATVSDTVLASGALVGAGAVVQGAIVGHGATVGAGARVPPGTRIDPGTQWGAGWDTGWSAGQDARRDTPVADTRQG